MSVVKATFCGDYCGKCPNFPDECDGCAPELHRDCHFVTCCTAQGIEHCGLCASFPCAALRAFCPDDRLECPPGYHIENLRARQCIGTDAWLEIQRARWGK